MKSYYISNKGIDTNDGSMNSPFATIEKAVEMIKLNEICEDTNFIIYGGEYNLEKGIIIESNEKYNICFQAKDQGKVIISGGVHLENWEKFDDKKWRTKVNNVQNVRHLYVNEKMAQRPTTPIIKTNTWEKVEGGEIEFYNQIEVFKSYIGDLKVYEGYKTSNKDMLLWKNKNNLECVYDVGWSHSICPVDDIVETDDGIIIKMRMPCFRECQIKGGVQIGAPSYIENVYELMENEGEWYFDKSEGYVYYIPYTNEDMNNCNAILPVLEQIVQIKGTIDKPVKNIKFDCIDFSYSTWTKPSTYGHPEIQANLAKGEEDDLEFHSNYVRAPGAILLEACENIVFTSCEFSKMGCGAFDILNGASFNIIENCKLKDISGTGIQIGGFRREDAHPDDMRVITRNNTVKNCEIHNIGVEYKGGVGVLVGYADGVLISHNEIYDISYTGISAGWGWGYWDENSEYMCFDKPLPHYPRYNKSTIGMNLIIEYNHIHHVMQKLHDGGGIYTISMNENSKIIGNLVHDNGKFTGGFQHNGLYVKRPQDDEEYALKLVTQNGYPGGIYLDQASGGFEVRDNIIYNVICAIFYHDYDMRGVFHTNSFINNYCNIKPEDTGFPRDKVKFAGIQKWGGFHDESDR